MKARPTRVVSVGVLTCALVLTGCSKDTTASPPASSPASASGSTATGSATTSAGDEVRGRSGAFTVVPPEGWTEATDKATGVADIDLVLLSSKKVGAFANNLVVTSAAGDQSVLDGELAKGRQQLGAAGRTVSSAPDKSVSGSSAVGFTTTFEQQGIKVLARSYGVARAGRIYLLTLSSSQADATHAMAEFDELLSTWAWT
ncbi:hypothetical protein [Terracoccus sp. 273MFTsu3.1]|uniref:hypothetical protein n=1 Tax=Terracoccus sp. 273MFTsu3.1 TaxID=1172188 RepID=UPI000371A009|nr:hypothetical protein [Terracoccus sp. 273MFTsu3.1]